MYKGKVIAMENRQPQRYARWTAITLTGVLLCLVLMNLQEFFVIFSLFTKAMAPVLYGIVFAFLLNPMVNLVDQYLPRLLRKKIKNEKRVKGISRAVGIVIALLAGGFLIYGLFYLILPQLYESLMNILGNFSTYYTKVESWIMGLLEDNPELRASAEKMLDEIYGKLDSLLDPNGVVFASLGKLLTGLTSSVLSIVSGLMEVLVGVVASVYILWSKDTFMAQANKLVVATCQPQQADKILHMGREIQRVFGGFISGQLIEALLVGILCYVGMLILRLPYPLLIATVVGVTNIIPFFGPFIGAIPSAFLILMISPVQCFYFIIFILILQQIEGNILAPRILGDSIGISGFWVLVSITVAGNLFGFAGMILGAPVFALIYILVKDWMGEKLRKKKRPTQTADYMDLQEMSELPYISEEDPDQIQFDAKTE